MIVFYIIPLVVCVVLLVLYFAALFSKKEHFNALQNFPKVSVLVAARNEAETIERCIAALSNLSYKNIEILIGNDHSTDSTAAIIQEAIKDKPHFKFIDIVKVLPNTKGKSNVLAQLAQVSTGEFLFVTDADTAVPNHWIEAMLKAFTPQTGIVTGMTTLKPTNLFHKLQQIDWLYALALVKVVSDFKLPVTSMGNNMAIRKEAYLQTGGYENLPFSITEDFQLFKEIVQRKWQFYNLFEKEVLAISLPITSVITLLHQRKRWSVGVFQLPWYFLILLLFQAAFYPVALLLLVFDYQVALCIMVFKQTIQLLFIMHAYKKLQHPVSIVALLLFELYSATLSLMLLLFYVLPVKVNWKGRKYK